MRINRDKQSAAARQYLILLIQNFSLIDVLAPADPHFKRLHAQRPVQWNWLQVIHFNLRSEGDYVAELVDLTHSLVENRCNNSTVAMSGRTRVPLSQPKPANKPAAFFVIGKLQAHAIRIICSAPEAVIPLEFYVAGIVTFGVGLAGHRSDFIVNCLPVNGHQFGDRRC